MMHRLTQIWEFLFPPASPVQHIAHETPAMFLRTFRPHRFLSTVALSTYADPVVRSAILANKFHHDTHAAHLLASLLTHWLTTQPDASYVIVPIPLSQQRLRERGHNQVATIAHLAATNWPVAIDEHLLIRSKHIRAQTQRTREERFNGLHNVFTGPEGHILPKDIHLILLDDVITTGATMRAAQATLTHTYPHHPVTCVALAH